MSGIAVTLKQSNMELSKALLIASGIVNQLAPHCTRIDIAGSCRREKPDVKDIEIVCLPKEVVLKDMFGLDERVTRDLEFSKKVIRLGKVIKGRTDGRYIQIRLPQDINLDLFMPDADDYFRQLAIRTGSADYSHKVIASAWAALGWVGTEKGLRRVEDCEKISISGGKYKWKIVNPNGQLPPAWKSEEEFFQWLNIKWIKPTERNADFSNSQVKDLNGLKSIGGSADFGNRK